MEVQKDWPAGVSSAPYWQGSLAAAGVLWVWDLGFTGCVPIAESENRNQKKCWSVLNKNNGLVALLERARDRAGVSSRGLPGGKDYPQRRQSLTAESKQALIII